MAESVVGPWARDKLDRLDKYLKAYTAIMKGQRWCRGYHYIDAFAGPGQHTVRKEIDKRHEARQRFSMHTHLAASKRSSKNSWPAHRAWRSSLEHPFTNYVFVEHSAERSAALAILKEEFGSTRSIHIRQEDCTRYLRDKIAFNPKIDWITNRALVFLDPFGMQVGWQTIADLAATKAVEIFLNFPVGMAIQRLLCASRTSSPSALRRRLDEYFGCSDWHAALYRSTRNLFGDDQEQKIDESGKALLTWYRKRLRTVFSHVSRAALIRNTRVRNPHHLLLASHNATAVRIANDILAAGEAI